MSRLRPLLLVLSALSFGLGACGNGDESPAAPGGGSGTGGLLPDPCAGACGPLEACVVGQCVCAAPREACGDECVDVTSDPRHCGACGTPCAQGRVCSFGECGESCTGGRISCSGACVDIASDNAHCGGCDQPCRSGEVCLGRACTFVATGGAGAGGISAGGANTGGATEGGTTSGGAPPTGGTAVGGQTTSGGRSAGGMTATTGGTSTGGTSSGGSATGGTRTGGTGTTGGSATGGVPTSELVVTPVPANGTIGLDWPRVQGASSYNIYWSASPGVTIATGTKITNAPRGYVHRSLPNGTTYHYVVTAVTAAGESVASREVSATPTGEWVLEELGTGDFVDVRSGAPAPTVALPKRIHLLLFAEGYPTATLPTFHDHALHGTTRATDVDRWVDEVFRIEPYSLLREAFVIWYLPRASPTDIRAANRDTAFDVPVDVSSSFAQTGSISTTGPTATAAWEAIGLHPFAPTDFTGPGSRGARNAIASFLIYDPNQRRASVSGRATSLTNPANSQQSIAAAFGVGHAHEFSHSFALLRDEYLENDNGAPSRSSTSNVVNTNRCSELPWAHLLVGTPINPSTSNLVGAFGTSARGFHSELLCLMNGTHDNGEYYARGDAGACQASGCTLRVETRMCNFCRETTALRILQRSGVLPVDESGVTSWTASYRTPFYDRYHFQIPAQVPQSNDIRNPSRGTTIYEACVP